ncbi:unnamed protein product [Rhizophagus irregularis]|nr:unnamed protein product [Rhizophagus irregularis]CAB5183197.1 unnamed protein product [Rhizophagus irregularis]
MTFKGKFQLRYDSNKQCSLISLIIQTFKIPTSSFSNHYAVVCGTGFELLSLEKTLGSLEIAKLDFDVDKLTNFGRWYNIAYVKEYVSSSASKKI